MKRQKYIEGSIVTILLSNDKVAFGRLFPKFIIGVYDKIYLLKQVRDLSLNEIIQDGFIFYVHLFKPMITKGIFEIIGHKDLTEKETKQIPSFYLQDIGNPNSCTILHFDGRTEIVTADKCVNMECLATWDEFGIVERVEDFLAGKPNKYLLLDQNNLRKGIKSLL